MTTRRKLIGCVGVALVLVCTIVVVGCGRNPLLGSLSTGGFKVGVGRLETVGGSGAPRFRAHSSADPTNFVLTVTSINLTRDDGSMVSVWHGSEEVDLTKVTSLADIKAFNVDVPPGTYKQFKLFCKSSYIKVRGSVVVDGTTYYTKTSHTNYTTPPAELEEIKIHGHGLGGFPLLVDFDPPVKLGGNSVIEGAYVLVDLSSYLTYWDGNATTSGNPLGFLDNLSSHTSAGMVLATPLAYAITMGAPAKKEIYQYTAPGVTGAGQLTIIYDASDHPVGATVRPLYLNSSGQQFTLHGWLSESYGGNLNPRYIQKNSDGTLNIQIKAYEGDIIVFANFQRASHSGTYTRGAGAIGTYTATKLP